MKKIKNETIPSLAFHGVAPVKKTSLVKQKVVFCYISAGAATLVGGILHLMMIGPSLKPYNFPMELLPYTDTLFIIAG